MDLAQLLTRLKRLAASLTPSQRLSLVSAFVAVVGICVASAYWVGKTDYALLFSDLDAEAASDVVTRLKAEKVDYELDAGGRAVRVPASRVDELRLEFASQGLPSSGRIGFEIFDRTAFGATEFLEQVNYRRALEGEIARTISTLSEVAGARVHIARARPSLFASKEQPAKASVVLKLRNNRPLAASTVQGITNLVAAGVEGLRPEAVVILDTFGHPLARPAADENGPTDGAQMERQQRIEKDLTAKVAALLEPVVGAAGVRVNVSARLDARTEEATEEKWDPESTVVRSRQVSGDVSSFSAAQGLAGARANLPASADAAAPAPPPPPSSGGRGSETTNYEISKVTRHTVRPRGDIARLSVAVILDNEGVTSKQADGTMARTTRARTPEELQKIHGLVAAAVGLDAERGDQLTVENVPFEEVLIEEPPAAGVWQRVGPQVMDGLRIFALVIVALFAFLFVVRPLMRRVATGATAPSTVSVGGMPQQLPRTVQDLEGEIEAQLDALLVEKSSEHRKLPVLTRRLTELSVKEPEHAARLLRTWMGEDPH